MYRLALASSLAFFVAGEHRAHAFAACGNGEGWALQPGATLPVHPRLAYFMDGRRSHGGNVPPSISATIAGKAVPVKLSFTTAAPYALALIEIDSEQPGKLVITWGGATKDNGYFQAADPTATYVISASTKLPATAKGTGARFHQAYRHSTVHELDDGLEVRVDVPAIAFTARWRTDDKSPWQTLELTANTADGHQVARLGSLGCSTNFDVATLERGIDLELEALVPDGKKLKVTGLPAHYVLPALPKGAPQSQP